MSSQSSSMPQSKNDHVVNLDQCALILASLAFGLAPTRVSSGVFSKKKNGAFEIVLNLTDGEFRYFERQRLTSENFGSLPINQSEIVITQTINYIEDEERRTESVTRARTSPQSQWLLVANTPVCGSSNPYYLSIDMHDVPQFERRMVRVHKAVHSSFSHMI